jgi:hypothetical protein
MPDPSSLQPMNMGNEVTHMSVIHRALGFGLPCGMGAGIVWKNARRHGVFETSLKTFFSGVHKFAAKDKMQALGHGRSLDKPIWAG